MIQETSIQSYSELSRKALGDMQTAVLEVITSASNGLTDTEIAHRLGYEDINKTRPRRFELVDEGFIKNGGTRVCSRTGRETIFWILGATDINKKDCLGNEELNNIIKKINRANEFQLRKIQVIINGKLKTEGKQLRE